MWCDPVSERILSGAEWDWFRLGLSTLWDDEILRKEQDSRGQQ
jgi:hypothetical protein